VKAPDWSELWAIGIYDLGLDDDQFWRLTIRQFNKLVERHKENKRAELFNSALICSVIANVNRGKGKPFQPSDFMPKENKKKAKMTTEQMVEMLRMITLQNGGEVTC
jgi:hypothetical protein